MHDTFARPTTARPTTARPTTARPTTARPTNPPSAGWPPPVSDALRFLLDPTVTPRMASGTPTALALGVDATGWAVAADRPLDALVGWRAPAGCRAIGVVTPGRVLPGDRIPPSSAQGSEPPGAGPAGAGPIGVIPAGAAVEVAVVVDRSGATAGRLTVGGHVEDHPPAGGRLLDCLRRTLGLATPPPPEGTARLLAVLWMAEIIRMTATASSSPTWRHLLGCHPAVRLLDGSGPGLRLDQMQRIVTISPSTWTWDVLREAEAVCGTLPPLCPPGVAGWMDDGIYARWVLADLPTLEHLRARLTGSVPPALTRRLERALADSGLGATPVGAGAAR